MPKAFKMTKYTPPAGKYYVYIHDPWPYDNHQNRRTAQDALVNWTLVWVCSMVRDICKVEMDEHRLVLFRKGTSRDVIVELEAPDDSDITVFDAILGAHHARDFLLHPDPSDSDFSVIYRYDFERYNNPERKGWEDRSATKSFKPEDIPKVLPIKRDGSYPSPRPVERRYRTRVGDVAPLPGRLLEGHPECIPVPTHPPVQQAAELHEPPIAGPSGQSATAGPSPSPQQSYARPSSPIPSGWGWWTDAQAPAPAPAPAPVPALLRASEHAFVPYESNLPTSTRSLSPNASQRSPSPQPGKMGKMDPEDEENAAHAFLRAGPPVKIEVKTEPGSVLIKTEHVPEQPYVPSAEWMAAYERMQAFERERERERANAKTEGVDARMQVDDTQAAIGVKQEFVDIPVPAVVQPHHARSVKKEEVSGIIPAPPDSGRSATEMQALFERVEAERVARQQTTHTARKVKTEEVDMRDDSAVVVKSEPISGVIPPPYSKSSTAGRFIKPEPMDGRIAPETTRKSMEVKTEPADPALNHHSIPVRRQQFRGERQDPLQNSSREFNTRPPSGKQDSFEVKPETSELGGGLLTGRPRPSSPLPNRTFDPFDGYGEDVKKEEQESIPEFDSRQAPPAHSTSYPLPHRQQRPPGPSTYLSPPSYTHHPAESRGGYPIATGTLPPGVNRPHAPASFQQPQAQPRIKRERESDEYERDLYRSQHRSPTVPAPSPGPNMRDPRVRARLEREIKEQER
ncbi:hypothetical protein C8F01DRAFT_1106285 [Mycena amicta]|nr:hypothetical protein C8F01DRAFT_1106285 [Mycena amicta]